MNIEDESSASSSSSLSSSSYDAIANNPSSPSSPTSVPLISHKRKAGRKKFRETRHPVYSGVRKKNGDKWVCEIREPNKKSRIWLGTFPSPEMAARAHDVAALALRGEMAKLNFPDSARVLPRAKSSSARDIQMAALEATRAFQPPSSSSSSSSFKFSRNTNLRNVMRPSSISLSRVECQENLMQGSIESASVKVSDSSSSTALFVDEEALFNMPGLLDSMAEGLMLTPPALKTGFNWDDMGCDVDMTLWRD